MVSQHCRARWSLAAATSILVLGCSPASQPGTATDSQLTEEQQRVKEQLEAVGYAAGTGSSADIAGVTLHHPEAASPGLNLFTSGQAPAAYLVDMEGNEVHRWRYRFRDVWPKPRTAVGLHNRGAWRYVFPLGNGDLLAIFEGFGLIKLDRDSNLVWASDIRAHHDIDVAPGGEIYTLTREARILPRINPDELVLEDFVTVLGADGRIKDRFSLLEALEGSPFFAEVAGRLPSSGDLFHTNTLELLDGSKSHLSPLYAEGNILTSFRNLDTIAIVDGTTRTVAWTRSGDWGGQHYPTLLDDGRILLFLNQSSPRSSSVQIIDPLDGSIDWEYTGSPPESFFSGGCGGAQMLPNGNVLITESQAGRAFEVDSDGDIVWEFVNPHRLPRTNELGYLFLLTRYDPAQLEGSSAPPDSDLPVNADRDARPPHPG